MLLTESRRSDGDQNCYYGEDYKIEFRMELRRVGWEGRGDSKLGIKIGSCNG